MTETFLDEVVTYCRKNFGRLEGLQLVFPNRRAGLFFQKKLGQMTNQPTWSPQILSLEDFITAHDDLQVTDPLVLIFELYKAFKSTYAQVEGIERFYFWGEMLLKDFEDVDQSLVSADQIFQGVKSQKELEEFFYFLDEEDKAAIQSFWSQFMPSASPGQEQFLKTWKVLKPVYHQFQDNLLEKRLAYKGLIYRRVAQFCQDEEITGSDGPILFAGFNALTPAEEVIIKYFIANQNAQMIWDYDRYYLDDKQQEAGAYLRQYQQDSILGPSLADAPNWLQAKPKSITTYGVSLQIGQAKAAGDYLSKLLKDSNIDLEKTVIVLPKEHMLMPLLHSLPDKLQSINITMGYPLRETPLYGLMESLLYLQQHTTEARDYHLQFYHQPVVEILSHPYLSQVLPAFCTALLSQIREQNIIQVPERILQAAGNGDDLISAIFKKVPQEDSIIDYLEKILKLLYE